MGPPALATSRISSTPPPPASPAANDATRVRTVRPCTWHGPHLLSSAAVGWRRDTHVRPYDPLAHRAASLCRAVPRGAAPSSARPYGACCGVLRSAAQHAPPSCCGVLRSAAQHAPPSSRLLHSTTQPSSPASASASESADGPQSSPWGRASSPPPPCRSRVESTWPQARDAGKSRTIQCYLMPFLIGERTVASVGKASVCQAQCRFAARAHALRMLHRTEGLPRMKALRTLQPPDLHGRAAAVQHLAHVRQLLLRTQKGSIFLKRVPMSELRRGLWGQLFPAHAEALVEDYVARQGACTEGR
jgi:hypothetical protein